MGGPGKILAERGRFPTPPFHGNWAAAKIAAVAALSAGRR